MRIMFKICALLFQSTHPSGVRRACALVGSGVADFNPRTPVGRDSVLLN